MWGRLDRLQRSFSWNAEWNQFAEFSPPFEIALTNTKLVIFCWLLDATSVQIRFQRKWNSIVQIKSTHTDVYISASRVSYVNQVTPRWIVSELSNPFWFPSAELLLEIHSYHISYDIKQTNECVNESKWVFNSDPLLRIQVIEMKMKWNLWLTAPKGATPVN